MAKIKIISNPYRKSVSFHAWNEKTGEWIAISKETCPNSMLLREELREGFFPFKVCKILDIVAAEYHSDEENIDILFEGTDDEYKELILAFSNTKFNNTIQIQKAPVYLENARYILPEIKRVFRELTPLVLENITDKEKVKHDLDQFADASADTVPVCVIGNYSSGKSTFINALIGYELLPCSDEPTTAKIYKISQSEHTDRASVRFEYDCHVVNIELTDTAYKFTVDPEDNALVLKIRQILDIAKNDPISLRLNLILQEINDHANRSNDNSISDLVEVEAPFDDDGLWRKIGSRFVFFDTPGSNSASNNKHYMVLKKAMEDLSNGLPIFVSEYNALDSTDNDKLYQDINNMEELDNRFTMIIVNKADAASLKRTGFTDDERDRILNLAIPRKVYSGGIYFVSSIMGLGSKNDMNFIDEHYAEVFEDQYQKYADPNNRFYKTIYKYDILPEQIKGKYDALAAQQKNLVYANSGLYSVEQAIGTFAVVYSPYNKCQQLMLYLNNIITITEQEICDATQKKLESKNMLLARLDKDRKELLNQIDTESDNENRRFLEEYKFIMEPKTDEVIDYCPKDTLDELQDNLRIEKKEAKDIEGKAQNVKESVLDLLSNTSENLVSIFKYRNQSALRKTGNELHGSWRNLLNSIDDLQESRKAVGDEASDRLIAIVKERFIEKLTSARTQLEKTSRTFWESKSVVYRKALLDIVTASSALSEAQRQNLQGIIIEYKELMLMPPMDVIFDRSEFLRKVFGDVSRVKTEKLVNTYNSAMSEEIRKLSAELCRSHVRSFEAWKINLGQLITDNLIELNPELHVTSDMLTEVNTRISELELCIQRLHDYAAQITQLMDWKLPE